MFKSRVLTFAVVATATLATLVSATAQSNIDDSVPHKHAWCENVGWTNWRGEATPGQGAQAGPFVMSGFIWCENIGWITLGNGMPTDDCDGAPCYGIGSGPETGVSISLDGTLHGYAWGENVGWISFDGGAFASPPQPARIECAAPPTQPLARLTGYAWGENIGWINLSLLTAGQFVAIEAQATPLLCDVNHDGLVDGCDIQSFVDLLFNGALSWRDICSGDQPPQDGTIDIADVSQFVACLLTAS